jgi:hypothetical protein
MGALAGALIAKGIAKGAGNVFGGRPFFSGMFGSRGGSSPSSTSTGGAFPTNQFGQPVAFSSGGAFSGKPFGNAPMGTGTLMDIDPSSAMGGQNKSGLGSMLGGFGNAVGSGVNAVGGLLGNLLGGGASTPAAPTATLPSNEKKEKAGLTGSTDSSGQQSWNAGAEGYTPIHIDGFAGPDLYGAEVTMAPK